MKFWPLILGLVASTASAEKTPAAVGDKVVFQKKTVIDLTGAIIEGELTKPDGSYIVNRKISRFSSLIKLRENFIPELISSADHL
jgi:hypothetical protein